METTHFYLLPITISTKPFLKKTENSSSGTLKVCVEPPVYTREWFHQYTQLEPDGNVTWTVDELLIIGATRMSSPKR